jgi:UDP-N-acetylglucosamine 2-epimerase (non-hydrolysing)
MKKVLLVLGTRPDAIKLAPLFFELKKHKEDFEVRVCITAQHREMLDQVLIFFDIKADYDLNLMKHHQDLYTLTTDIILCLKPILEDFNPNFVFVQGDTTTAMAGSIAAFYHRSKIVHIEAGLRTNNLQAPYPEEMNRRIISIMADWNFAPTENAKKNLLLENKNPATIFVTGNTVIDALHYSVDKLRSYTDNEILYLKNNVLHPSRKMILVTGHRRESFGEGFIHICEALKIIAHNNPSIDIVYPVHLNPNVQEPVNRLLQNIPQIHLIKPVGYPAFVWLMMNAHFIITDSGGVQEEAPSLGKPVLVMRDTTERPEALEAGTVLLVGTDKDKIIAATQHLIDDHKLYEKMSHAHNPYGDGSASKRIIEVIKNIA